ncbi:MAG: AAA family ATPase, partial [Actinobacteria bacterium]|nr:AAA family ATPase [Actinomycetota bacterium]
MNDALERMLHRAELLMARIERILPQALHAPDWQAGIAFRYRKRSSGHGVLEPVRHIGQMSLDD